MGNWVDEVDETVSTTEFVDDTVSAGVWYRYAVAPDADEFTVWVEAKVTP